jgi:hypothetical protein
LNRYGELGYFGNIWVRQNLLEKAGDTNDGGHEHKFDHVSLLTQGKVSVEIEGHPAKEFTAPTFIVIRKEHKHKFTALEDNTVWYCVFALRDLDGEPIEELFSPEMHDPKSAAKVDDGYWEKAKQLDEKTTHEDE